MKLTSKRTSDGRYEVQTEKGTYKIMRYGDRFGTRWKLRGPDVEDNLKWHCTKKRCMEHIQTLLDE